MAELVYVGGVAGRLTAVNAIAYGQPGIAVATNGLTASYSDSASALHAIGTVTKNLRTLMVGGASAVGLN
jgi:hypothetical protein